MTKQQDNEENLISFLRQHRPQIPPSSPELEDKIFQQVFQYQENKSKCEKRRDIAILLIIDV